MKNIFLIFLGPPGSGKGTQAELSGRKLALPVVSTGNLLRRERERGTKLGRKVAAVLESGVLVSDEIVNRIISNYFKQKKISKGAIFDGFPRNKSQNDFLTNEIEKNIKDGYGVYAILIELSDKEVLERLGGRRVCPNCGASYHVKYNPSEKKGVCDVCGSKLQIRDDDKPAVIKKRLAFYHRDVNPIIKYWQKKNKIIKINGSQNIAKVNREIIKNFNLIK